jgi:hypothetical protein
VGRRKHNNKGSRVRYYGRRGEDVMHGLTVMLDSGPIDIEVSDDVVCRGAMCDHDEKGLDHANGDRVSRVTIATKREKFARHLAHLVYVGAKLKPVRVLQTEGLFDLHCCQKQKWVAPAPGKRSRLAGQTPRSPSMPDMHILGVLNAMGRVKIRFRPEAIRKPAPVAVRLPAPQDHIDPRTLEDDTPTPRQALPAVDLNHRPPSNHVTFTVRPDGSLNYTGPEGETTRLLARHSARLSSVAQGTTRFVAPEDAFDPRIVAALILEAGKEGIAEPDIYQARVEELGENAILDEEASLRYLEKLRPEIEERIRKIGNGRFLHMDQQRLRGGGTVMVLACR